MKINFEQTEEDVLNLQKTMLKKSKYSKVMVIAFIAIFLFAIVRVFLEDDVNLTSLIVAVIPILVIGSLWLILIRFFLRRTIRKPHTKNMALGHREIDLSETVIKVKTPVAYTEYQWSIITEMIETTTAYVLYIGKTQAIPIPKRAFMNDAEKIEFEKLVRSKLG